jgi:hypothetical protein
MISCWMETVLVLGTDVDAVVGTDMASTDVETVLLIMAGGMWVVAVLETEEGAIDAASEVLRMKAAAVRVPST